MAGKLYLVATPIGNLEDITLRAIRVLREADKVAAEDTRQTRKLLRHLEINQPVVSYHDHNKQQAGAALLAGLLAGESIALVSDAGTPAVSDPGQELVQAAIAAGVEVIAVPGASAVLTALVGSGLDCSRFAFEGFLPREKGRRQQKLIQLVAEERTMVFYEAPHRLLATLADMAAVWPQRSLAVARELTKFYEETVRGPVERCLAHFQQHPPRGEFTIVAAGAAPPVVPSVSPAELGQEMTALMSTGLSRKVAARQLAQQYGLSTKQVYDASLAAAEEEDGHGGA